MTIGCPSDLSVHHSSAYTKSSFSFADRSRVKTISTARVSAKLMPRDGPEYSRHRLNVKYVIPAPVLENEYVRALQEEPFFYYSMHFFPPS